MICEVCRRTLSREEHLKDGATSSDQSEFLPHHLDAISLRDAAEVVKCPICHDFWSQLSLHGQRRLIEKYGRDPPGPIVKAMLSTSDRGSISVPVLALFLNERLSLGGIEENTVFFTNFTFHSVAEQSELIEASRSAAKQTEYDLARSWLRTCEANHVKCNSESDRDDWNLTRLLDVGVSGDLIKVVANTTDSKCLEYVTLSHAWGSAKFIQLTRHIEQALIAGITVTQLPKTFQDAIEVTRALGKRYLWIDSLCIKQDRDDLSDWLREASLMHKVYRHEYCNISATGVKDSSEGLFRQRVPELLQLQQVEVGIEGRDGSLEKVQYVVLNGISWHRNVTNAHLNTRGWVLQERLLASRVLHFGQDQLLWECREFNAAQTFPSGIPSDILPSGFKGLDPETDGARLRQLGKKDRDRRFWAHELWYRIANAYTSCNLTKPQDKLIAISGIAKHMTPILKDEYMAGMWRRFLASQLLWQVTEVLQESSNDTYIAPSWSWASQPLSKVNHNQPDDDSVRFEVKDVALNYQNEDVTGLVTGGHIVLEGILKKVDLIKRTDYDRLIERYRWCLAINGKQMIGQIDHPPYKDGGQCYLDTPDLALQSNPYYALEGQFRETYEAGKYAFSMLLLRCEDHEKGTFSRVGLHVSLQQDLWEQLMERDENEASLPCMSWNRETRLHTIRVI